MYIAYHDQNNKLHIVHDYEKQYLCSWGTSHQRSVYVKDNQVIEKCRNFMPKKSGDDTWTSNQQVLGIVDFTGSNLGELVSQHKQWFKTFVEQTNE